MKKSILFTLFGNNRRYLNGAVQNAILSRGIFPDWDIIFYVWNNSRYSNLEKALETCLELNPKIIIKNFNFDDNDDFLKSLNPKMLRYLIHDDNNYDFYWIRDIDTNLNLRCRKVIEWILTQDIKFGSINDYINNKWASYFTSSGLIGRPGSFFNMKNEMNIFFNNHTNYYQIIKNTFGINKLTSSTLYGLHSVILSKDSGLICQDKIPIEQKFYNIDEEFFRWLILKYRDKFISFVTENDVIERIKQDNIIYKQIIIPRLDNEDFMEKTTYYHNINLF